MKKNKSRLSFGPGASSLILIFVVLSMTVLGMLSLMTARNDLNLSRRSVQVVEAQYALNIMAEQKRAVLDQVFCECAAQSADDATYLDLIENSLPDDATLDRDSRLVSFSFSDEIRMLECALYIHPLGDTAGRESWHTHNLTAVAALSEDDLWN